MPEWEIQRLNRQHDRVNFDCGHLSLNAWLKERAGQFDRKDYMKFGFNPLLDDPRHLYLSIQVIRKLNLPGL